MFGYLIFLFVLVIGFFLFYGCLLKFGEENVGLGCRILEIW